MERTTAVTLGLLVVAGSALLGGISDTPTTSVAAQDGERTALTVEIIPNRTTALQNESTSLAVQVHNQENNDRYVLVRVFEPHGVSGMRVRGEPPTIPQNNTEMWQLSETLEPRQRLLIPITIEPGSDPGQHPVHVQVNYVNESGTYTDKWKTGMLVIEQCSATCKARGALKIVLEFLVSYRNTVIAVLSLTVAILSLTFTIRRRTAHS